jgi:hypothetical protein
VAAEPFWQHEDLLMVHVHRQDGMVIVFDVGRYTEAQDAVLLVGLERVEDNAREIGRVEPPPQVTGLLVWRRAP